MKSCLSEYTIRTTPTIEILRLAAKNDFDGVDFAWEKLLPEINNNELPRIERALKEYGIQPVLINLPDFCTLLGKEQFERFLGQAKTLASTARTLGCNLLQTTPSFIEEPLEKDAMIKRTVDSLNRIADICGEDMSIGFEFLGYNGSSVKDLETTKEIITRLGRRNVGMVLDSFMFHLQGIPLTEVATVEKEKISCVQVSDSEPGSFKDRTIEETDACRVLPGRGIMKLGLFISSLIRTGYEGFVSLELCNPRYWEQNPQHVVEVGRNSFKSVLGI